MAVPVRVSLLIVLLALLAEVSRAEGQAQTPPPITVDLNGDGEAEVVSLTRELIPDRLPLRKWYVEVKSKAGLARSGPYEALAPQGQLTSRVPPQLGAMTLVPLDKPVCVADVNLDGRSEILIQWRLPMSGTNIRTVVLLWEPREKKLQTLFDHESDGVLFTDADRDGVAEALCYYVDALVPVFYRALVWKQGRYQELPRTPAPVAMVMAPLYREKVGAFVVMGVFSMLRAHAEAARISGDRQLQVEALNAVSHALGELEAAEKTARTRRTEALLLLGDTFLATGVTDEALKSYCQSYEIKAEEGFATAEGFGAARLAKGLAEKGHHEAALQWVQRAEKAEQRDLPALRGQVARASAASGESR